MIYYALKQNKDIEIQDIVLGPKPNGDYDLNMFNLLIFGVDHNKGTIYKFDDKGNGSPYNNPVVFDEEEDVVIAKAGSFDKLIKKLDKTIKKHLFWINGCCVGISYTEREESEEN